VTTSAGRLFDAVGVIALGIDQADFDGDLAMRLEAVADRTSTERYNISLEERELLEVDWRPLMVELLADRDAGVEAPAMAMKFHRALAWAIVQVCRRQSHLPTVLTGGVFQNRLLTELVCELWADDQPLGTPGVIPPNDGGLAAGQLAVAAARERTLCV
jgi:hydrogenase maturation protein HypF